MIIHGDSLEELKKLDADSIDAVVTDPPYGWRFMGKAWDRPDIERMTQERMQHQQTLGKNGVLRASPRCAPSESAGKYDQSLTANQSFQNWTEMWAKEVFRVLRPGGHALVFCGPRTYHRMAAGVEDAGFEIRDQLQWLFGSGFPKSHNLGDGRGTALKPANEPIVLARKPLSEKTVAKNVLKHGTGALNIDGSRIGTASDMNANDFDDSKRTSPKFSGKFNNGEVGEYRSRTGVVPNSRWPANVLFDEEAAAMLGEPSRFFYVAKASKRERNAGLEGMPEKDKSIYSSGILSAVNSDPINMSGGGNRPAANHHPTVKPIKLMEYLCRLITPPGGVILDPFMGSGSTGVAAAKLGFRFIGIEREKEYCEIATKRIEHATESEQLELDTTT